MDERPSMERAMSTEVVIDIVLSHLKVRDLLSCRQVSKFWIKAASSVLRKRSTSIKNIEGKADLTKLEKCMKKTMDFPFAGLMFRKPWNLNSRRVEEFFKNYGETFTSLWLGISTKTIVQDVTPFVNHLPRLAIFQAGYADAKLYLESEAGQISGQILNLPSLRILRISSELDEDFLRQVFTAASPSLRIECPFAFYKTLAAVKKTGKLQAVPVLEVLCQRDSEYALRVDELLSTGSPSLTELKFTAGGCISQTGLINLLISSQHTLKMLHLDGTCPSELSLECPVLASLTTLSVDCDESNEHVFQGNQGHKFPALKELNLSIWNKPSIANWSDDLFLAPSVKKINLKGCTANKDAIEALARSFPNVIEIRLNLWNNTNDPSDIWSVGAFKFLEKLEIWDYPVKRPSKKYMNMDSFLTGMSIGICNNLRKHAPQNLMDSPFNEILRESPSILHLQNLKQLMVCVDFEDELEALPEEPPFISMVSVWYALQMMPNLEARFVYEHDSRSWRFEKKLRKIAVKMLKAAFKHVHPHVKLEPFFD